MVSSEEWHDLGEVAELSKRPLQQIEVAGKKIALVFKDGQFSAISGVCNHVGGPLGDGCLEGDYVVCPWHYYKFHWKTGEGEPGFEEDRVPTFPVKTENGRVLLSLNRLTTRNHKFHEPMHLARKPERAPGPLRVAGISTTAMDLKYPRPSTSEMLLESSLKHAKFLGFDTHLVKLRELNFRHCEGFYSKSSHACIWPCSITQLDPNDQLDQVYEDLVHWADIILIATPIRWGSASALYFKMVERLNCIQNQITIHNNQLICNKVAGFIITGGQDNVQAVAGSMMGFFSELGFHLPPFPFIAHSLGWSMENMEHNVRYVQQSKVLVDATKDLVNRCATLSHSLIAANAPGTLQNRAGRKAFNTRDHEDDPNLNSQI
ncbi:Rieske 2Fe-2S domain-containing protein [Bdellovibrio reynosensis]|uniref:NAD(P)H-dependent oxidoreductase n=1 Tax=Bdellovibrio reynosensis TaxID=2835041 RepID=A0ABY4CE64_9BACT|nr:Rieske 2Fe-2S domain-containing protein [Bdellovibrio reynosensis]UOF00505.1 NAD(P)H-dependent oxidoreductase [Bdellovibrio reynosensis]